MVIKVLLRKQVIVPALNGFILFLFILLSGLLRLLFVDRGRFLPLLVNYLLFLHIFQDDVLVRLVEQLLILFLEVIVRLGVLFL